MSQSRNLLSPMAHLLAGRSTVSRRDALAGGLAAAVTAGVMAGLPHAVAQRRSEPAEVSVEELMKPGDLPELVLGDPNAPVTIVEYASMTCGHCASFHNKVLPDLKTKYIDTGRVRLVLREFPLDNLAAAASMLARCTGPDKAQAFIGVMFLKQEEWAFARSNPVPKLFEMAKQAGFTQESFDKCLTDQKLLDQVSAVRNRATEQFGVSSTPTFFINGKRLTGAPTLAEFDKALAPLLKS